MFHDHSTLQPMLLQKSQMRVFRSIFDGFFRRTVRFNGNQAQNVGRVTRRLEMNTAAPLSHKFNARESMPLFEFGNPVSKQRAKISYAASDV
jgi:hypothetical protein